MYSYINDYVKRGRDVTFRDIFLSYTDENFEAEVIINEEKPKKMNREEYADFLSSYCLNRPALNHSVLQKCIIPSVKFANLAGKFLTIRKLEPDRYAIVVEKYQYYFLDDKLVKLIDKRIDSLYFDELEHLDYIALYPFVSLDNISIKWHMGYHDGMLTGVVEYQNKLVWVKCCDDIYDYYCPADENLDVDEVKIPGFTFFRRYIMYELSDDDIADLTYWHDLFCKHVGNHCNYIDNKRTRERCLPSASHDLFYTTYKSAEKRDYCQGRIIGWFQI